ncbi:MAG: hypothetical protein AB1798_13160, partial [Spirochaetota bacterium]
ALTLYYFERVTGLWGKKSSKNIIKRLDEILFTIYKPGAENPNLEMNPKKTIRAGFILGGSFILANWILTIFSFIW